MILIVNSAAEEHSAWQALDVIQVLRSREPRTLRPDVVEDTPWVRTRWANKKYL